VRVLAVKEGSYERREAVEEAVLGTERDRPEGAPRRRKGLSGGGSKEVKCGLGLQQFLRRGANSGSKRKEGSRKLGGKKKNEGSRGEGRSGSGLS